MKKTCVCSLIIQLVDSLCCVSPLKLLTHLAAAYRFDAIREVPVRKHPPETNSAQCMLQYSTVHLGVFVPVCFVGGG